LEQSASAPTPLDELRRGSTSEGGSARDGAVKDILGDGMLEPEQVVVLDLSVGSPLVAGDPAENCSTALGRLINDVLREARAAIGVGRYLEHRILYSSPLFESPGPPSLRFGAAGTDGERRTVHLGVDLFAPAGTPVRSPFHGVVHAFADNPAPLDYGPALRPVEGAVIILQHATDDGETFFTLYGHLTPESIEGLTPGKTIQAGETFAAIGAEDVNGGRPPHLHLQVIVDLLDLGCGFPGVCRSSESSVWRWLSPDPNLVLRIPTQKFPEAAADKQQTLAIRCARIGPNLSLAYREPLKIVRGWMQYLFDETGRRYLDAYNNVPHVGHCHPCVVRAAQQQMRVLNTNTRYLHDSLTEYAERLTATLPPALQVCYFVSSGSEANELALRLARAHTRRRDVIVLEAAYHGNTSTLIEISPYKFDGPGGGGRQPWVHVAAMPDVFRGMFRRDNPAAGRQYADCVRSIVETLSERGTRPACFIAETCPSVGGQIVFPPGYLAAVYSHVRAAGGVCIADEVQTAYGRMGSSLYAFEDQHVVPDILVLGKPIGNGYPLGAVITTPEIAASFDNGMEFFSTFGGSTVSCAVGLAVLDVVRQEQLQAHAQRVGTLVLDRLRPFRQRFPLVGDVRGSGLFLGIELVKDAVTLDPAAEEADYIVNRMREEGILLGTEGPFHNVLKIRPPMPFAETDAEILAGTLERVFEELD
jgi:4-aminobutyrate aminotransferase-like enzyme